MRWLRIRKERLSFHNIVHWPFSDIKGKEAHPSQFLYLFILVPQYIILFSICFLSLEEKG